MPELKTYECSIDATSDMDRLETLLREAREIVESENLKNWMVLTEQNYCSNSIALLKNLRVHLIETQRQFDGLQSDLDSCE
jgi:hypothetical protein